MCAQDKVKKRPALSDSCQGCDICFRQPAKPVQNQEFLTAQAAEQVEKMREILTAGKVNRTDLRAMIGVRSWPALDRRLQALNLVVNVNKETTKERRVYYWIDHVPA